MKRRPASAISPRALAQARLAGDAVLASGTGPMRVEQRAQVGVERAERGHDAGTGRRRRAAASAQHRVGDVGDPVDVVAQRRRPLASTRLSAGSVALQAPHASAAGRSPARRRRRAAARPRGATVEEACPRTAGSRRIAARRSSRRRATALSVASAEPISPATSSRRVPRSAAAVRAAPATMRPSAPSSRVAAPSCAARSRASGGVSASARVEPAPAAGDADAGVDRGAGAGRSRALRSKSWTTSSRSTPESAAARRRSPSASSALARARAQLEVGLVDDRVHADVGRRVGRQRPEARLRDVGRDGRAAALGGRARRR